MSPWLLSIIAVAVTAGVLTFLIGMLVWLIWDMRR